MNMQKKSVFSNSGFTLIEIMISIAIIAVLVTASTVYYGSAQKKSRDARRKSDLAQIQLALEAYKADNNTYPASALTALTSGNYMETLPSDPAKYTYSYTGLDNETNLSSSCGTNCQSYRLMMKTESVEGTVCGSGYGTCNGSINTCTYCLTPFGQQ